MRNENIVIRRATQEDMELLMSSRLEMLREVNDLADDYVYDESFVSCSREYFEKGDQTSVLALDGKRVIGCASISYITIMPTFMHPTGRRAHLMNVYTAKEYRGCGIAKEMVNLLIEDAWKRGATEISLDSTKAGRPLYERVGFTDSAEGMVLVNPAAVKAQ